MKSILATIIAIMALSLTACRSHKRRTAVGMYNTRAGAQAEADKVNALTKKQRAALKELGVHEQYLPCGRAMPVPTPTGYWMVEPDTTGCPPTAGEEDPNPSLPRTTRQPKSGGQK